VHHATALCCLDNARGAAPTEGWPGLRGVVLGGHPRRPNLADMRRRFDEAIHRRAYKLAPFGGALPTRVPKGPSTARVNYIPRA
jgi:hypothetical protein